jgi:hypothetical protein
VERDKLPGWNRWVCSTYARGLVCDGAHGYASSSPLRRTVRRVHFPARAAHLMRRSTRKIDDEESDKWPSAGKATRGERAWLSRALEIRVLS